MKNHLLRHCLLFVILTLGCLFAISVRAQTGPLIVAQPVSQTVDHGGNVTFTVTASGVDLSYQWEKDGKPLADYRNASGTGTDTLKLVGVAQIDAGSYTVTVRGAGGSVTSAVATLEVGPLIVLADDFESKGLKQWTAFSDLPGLSRAFHQTARQRKLAPYSHAALSPESIRLGTSTTQNHSPGGSRSAMLDSSRAKMFRNLGTEMAGRARVTFWMYDDGGTQNRWFGEVRGYSGTGHALYVSPNGMKQLLAIGCYNVGFGKNQTGTLIGEKVNSKKYQGKVERGANRGWFNLDNAPDRSVGWHEFQIVREADGTTVHFYVDGRLGRTITGADHVLLDCVTIGSVGAGKGEGMAWFDDVKVEAYPWRYDWQSKDSDGKGIFDWMKLRETGEDPKVTDVSQITTVAQVDAVGFSKAVGLWDTRGIEAGAIYCQGMRGGLEYQLHAPAADAYRLEIEGGERRGKTPTVKLPINVWVDDEFIGRFILPYEEKIDGFIHCFTPYLVAGPHTVRLYWDNAEKNCSLKLRAIRLQALAAPDLNKNGFKDWVESRVLAQSGLDPVPSTSFVSPVCVEGRGQYFSLIHCTAGASADQMKEVPVKAAAGYRWYSDVPLSAQEPTQIRVSHQHGVLEEACEIMWQPTDLLHAKDMVIRKGDSLLLTVNGAAAASDEVNISIDGVSTYATTASTPVAHRFDSAGTFVVTGTHIASGVTGSITVKVVEASFGSDIATWAAKRRFWDMENVPDGVVVDADPRLSLTPVSIKDRVQQKPAPFGLGPNSRRYSIINDASETRYVVARLGKNGPILARAAVEGFRVFNWCDTYVRYVQLHDDGSQTIEEAFIVSPMQDNITVKIQIIVSGVTFDDGTLTKTLTAADFDELGICRVRYIRADGVKTSVCHTTKVYQNGTLIGWPAYEK